MRRGGAIRLRPPGGGPAFTGPCFDLRDAAFANASPKIFWLESANNAIAFPANVHPVRTIGGRQYILIEGSRTNRSLHNAAIDDAAWTAFNGAAVTADQDTTPAGAADADEINHSTNATSGMRCPLILNAGLADNTSVAISVFSRCASGTEAWRSWAGMKNGAVGLTNRTATTTWQRIDQTQSTGTGSGDGWIILRNSAAGGARDIFHVWAQWEGGETGNNVYFPSSPIETAAAEVTRTADVCQLDGAQLYAPTFERKRRCYARPLFFSSDLQTGDVHYLYYIDASNHLAIVNSSGTVYVRWVSQGVIVQRAVTFTGARQQELTITIDPATGALTVAGATTGDGTTSGDGTVWTPGDLYVGHDAANSNHAFCVLSALEAVA